MIDQHFWLFCGLWVGLGNGVLIWSRRHKLIEGGTLTEGNIKRAAVGVSLWILLPSVCLWLLQLSAESNLGSMFLKWPSPQKELALALQVSAWLVLLFWVFVRDGDKAISLYLPAVGNWPTFMSTPMAVRVGTVLVVLGGVVAIFAHRG